DTRLYISKIFVWSITSRPSGLWRDAASLARKRFVLIPIEQLIHSPISLRKRFLISRPRSRIDPLYRQRVSVRSITASSMDLGVTSGEESRKIFRNIKCTALYFAGPGVRTITGGGWRRGALPLSPACIACVCVLTRGER